MPESFEDSLSSFELLIEKVCKAGAFGQDDASECKSLALDIFHR